MRLLGLLALAAALPMVASTPPAMTGADVEAFLDGLIPVLMQTRDIAGVTVSVVKDGKVLLVKGYGYADVAGHKPVSGDETLFRPGSISKLIVWTAVMQMVEQGKLDLDADINRYIDFTIPATYPAPITMRQIMTHRAGFQETVRELWVPGAAQLTPIGQYLRSHLPPRIFAPGAVPAYSNYGATLAGYVVERLSGEPFEQYVTNHVMKPLGMDHTTFVQPLPPDLQPLMSNGYALASGPAKPFEFVEVAPAGSSATTAADMARFALAHLQDGGPLLKPQTARLMHSRQPAGDSPMHAMCLGFYEETRNGHRIIGHGGDTAWFHSDLHLVPDLNLGFFISQNSVGKEGVIRGIVWDNFLDRYAPYTAPEAGSLSTAKQDSARFAGQYKPTRRFNSTFLRILALAGIVKVSANSDGTIYVSALTKWNGKQKKFHEIGAALYRSEDGEDFVSFREDAMDLNFAALAFQRVAWYENQTMNLVLIGTSCTVFALMLLLWPVSALVRWHYGKKLALDGIGRRLRLLVRITCLLDLSFLAIFLAFGASIDEPSVLGPQSDVKIHLIQFVGILGACGTVFAIANALRTKGITQTAVAIACIVYVWFTMQWGLLNLTTHY